jgi:hypothetical protein
LVGQIVERGGLRYVLIKVDGIYEIQIYQVGIQQWLLIRKKVIEALEAICDEINPPEFCYQFLAAYGVQDRKYYKAL